MKECFGYVRVSTAKQGEGVSLEAQRDAILRFAERNDITIARWFEEKLTAAKSGRPVFGAMLKALRAGKAAGVVMHKIDRSARNFADWAKIGDLADAGIDVHFATESLDFRSRGGRLAADIQAVVAADYIRNLREEAIKGLTGRLKQGIYPFKAPIGYLDNGGGKPKTLDPARAPLVRLAFELYGRGEHSMRSLRGELARRGLRTDGGRPVSKTGMENILANPFYCGLIRIKTTGAVYRGVHEPLISAHLFERVQEIKAGKTGKKVTRHNHRYRGLFRCGLCVAAMTPERQKGHVYYRCHTAECRTTGAREEALEAAVKRALARVRLTDDQVRRATAWAEGLASDAGREKAEATARLQLAQVDSRLNRLTDALVNGVIDQATFTRRKEALSLERMRWEEVLAERHDSEAEAAHLARFLELIKTLAETYEIADPPQKRRIAEMATSNRTVSLRNPSVEPAKWLNAVEETLSVHDGPHYRSTSRRGRHLRKEHIERLIEISRSATSVIDALHPPDCLDGRHQ